MSAGSLDDGLVSSFCLYFIAPYLADVALQFRAADLCSLVFFGLTVICSFAARSLVKGLLSGVIGLLLVTVGQDLVMGTARFTLGRVELLSGLHFLTALIGLFAIPQLMDNLLEVARGQQTASAQSRFGRIWPSLTDLKAMRFPAGIGSVGGTFIGILPGAGGADCRLY